MTERKFKLEIVSPQRAVYSGEVNSVRAPGIEGSFEVLYGHIPFLTALGVGEVSFRDEKGWRYLATGEGFLEVLRSGVSVVVESAEWPEDIDLERAGRARDRASGRLSSADSTIDRERAQAALDRASSRLRVAGRRK
jgi:F-type H+-transporting ATPase subunit epsilon